MPERRKPMPGSLYFTRAQRASVNEYVDRCLEIMGSEGQPLSLTRAKRRRLVAACLEAIPKHLRGRRSL